MTPSGRRESAPRSPGGDPGEAATATECGDAAEPPGIPIVCSLPRTGKRVMPMTVHRPDAYEHFLRELPAHKCLTCDVRLQQKVGVRGSRLVEVRSAAG